MIQDPILATRIATVTKCMRQPPVPTSSLYLQVLIYFRSRESQNHPPR